MTIHLLYFASFREAVGRDTEARQLREGTRVRDLWETLRGEFPYFRGFAAMPPAAVNRDYADADRRLSDGDEVAFLPPVAGG